MTIRMIPLDEDAVVPDALEVDEDTLEVILATQAMIQWHLKTPQQHHLLLPRLLASLQNLEPRLFWPAFEPGWSCCGETWTHRKWVLKALQRQFSQGHFEGFAHPDTVAFYQSLPDVVTLYRGCSVSRRQGISWTTDQAVAQTFAANVQRRRSSTPCGLYRARISRNDILAVVALHRESEIIADPLSLSNVEVVDWLPIPPSLDKNAYAVGPIPRPAVTRQYVLKSEKRAD